MKRVILIAAVLAVGVAAAGWRGRFDEQFAAASSAGDPHTPLQWVQSNGAVALPTDVVFHSGWLTAKVTLVASFAKTPQHAFTSRVAEGGVVKEAGLRFSAQNNDRRNSPQYGSQSWWNEAWADQYTLGVFHTFSWQHSSELRVFGPEYKRDDVSVTMYAASVGGNSLLSDRDPTFSSMPLVVFGSWEDGVASATIYGSSGAKFARLRIEFGGVVVADVIPARQGAVIGTYNRVTRKFTKGVGVGPLTYLE